MRLGDLEACAPIGCEPVASPDPVCSWRLVDEPCDGKAREEHSFPAVARFSIAALA